LAWPLQKSLVCYRRDVLRLRGLVIAALLAGAPTGCLLYTDEINVAPEVAIAGPREIKKRKKAHFTAVPRDPDEAPGALDLRWYERDGACPASLSEALMISATPTAGPEHDTVERERSGTFCVWVIATDRQRAQGLGTAQIIVTNTRPMPAIAIVEPVGAAPPATVPLYSQVQLSAGKEKEDDDDPLTYHWSVTLPDGHSEEPGPCTPPIQGAVCGRLDTPGPYRYELQAFDNEGAGERPATLTITALPDAPPCIGTTEPPVELPRLVASPLQATKLQVIAAQDDGDPFPAFQGLATTSSFVWHIRRGHTGPFERSTRGLPELRFPANTFSPGDVVEVRVEYRDRAGARDLTTCDVEKASCELTPGCRQWVTWTVEYL
jgi:hypothetical protein